MIAREAKKARGAERSSRLASRHATNPPAKPPAKPAAKPAAKPTANAKPPKRPREPAAEAEAAPEAQLPRDGAKKSRTVRRSKRGRDAWRRLFPAGRAPTYLVGCESVPGSCESLS